MTKKGQITYSLWTVKGTKQVNVKYVLEIENGDVYKGQIEVFGQGEEPVEITNSDTLDEILQECVADSGIIPEEFKGRIEYKDKEFKQQIKGKLLPEYNFGLN